jgi:hypothetical protein
MNPDGFEHPASRLLPLIHCLGADHSLSLMEQFIPEGGSMQALLDAEDDGRTAFHQHARVRSYHSSHGLSGRRPQSLHPSDMLEERLQGVSKLYWE